MSKILGDLGENYAAEYLKRKRYNVIERNYRVGRDEVDIIVSRGEYIIFVEVKTRTDDGFGTPAEAVTHTKQKRIMGVAASYMSWHEGKTARFDIVEIIGRVVRDKLKVESINHIENAFWGT